MKIENYSKKYFSLVLGVAFEKSIQQCRSEGFSGPNCHSLLYNIACDSRLFQDQFASVCLAFLAVVAVENR